MVIRNMTGNILDSDASALVVPVNTVGVAGAGLALAVKKKYPKWFRMYRASCNMNGLDIGKMLIHRDPVVDIISFPTKAHWRDPSNLVIIDRGLRSLRRMLGRYDISTVAIPRLGCGLGGLQWKDVRVLMDRHLTSTITECLIYHR